MRTIYILVTLLVGGLLSVACAPANTASAPTPTLEQTSTSPAATSTSTAPTTSGTTLTLDTDTVVAWRVRVNKIHGLIGDGEGFASGDGSIAVHTDTKDRFSIYVKDASGSIEAFFDGTVKTVLYDENGKNYTTATTNCPTDYSCAANTDESNQRFKHALKLFDTKAKNVFGDQYFVY